MTSKIIFSDIDGTLITSDLVISPMTQAVIKKAVAAGVKFVPVSARMPEAIKPIIDGLGFSYPIISYNGALVQDEKGRVIQSQPLDSRLAAEICTFLEQEWPEVVWNVYAFSKWLSQNRENVWIHREEVIVGLASEQVGLEKIEQEPAVHKLLLMGEPEVIDRLEEALKALYPELSIAKSLPYYIEVMAQGIDKGQAVRALASHYQTEIADTLGFGDNFNDLPMLDAVGIGYAMGNAPEAVKEQVGRVTADHNHDGIAQVLEALFS